MTITSFKQLLGFYYTVGPYSDEFFEFRHKLKFIQKLHHLWRHPGMHDIK